MGVSFMTQYTCTRCGFTDSSSGPCSSCKASAEWRKAMQETFDQNRSLFDKVRGRPCFIFMGVVCAVCALAIGITVVVTTGSFLEGGVIFGVLFTLALVWWLFAWRCPHANPYNPCSVFLLCKSQPHES